MVAPWDDWPPLSGGAEAEPRDFIERIMNANHDIKRLLDYIQSICEKTGFGLPFQNRKYITFRLSEEYIFLTILLKFIERFKVSTLATVSLVRNSEKG
jgi:hypothetical protein